ncbi:MAG TPA: tripartite tricarboxylate transporter substrate binding protein, partial [Burkholderiales bacterium]|nr:tripartite tricarboxylate transporter substrate binding protein [Burkholderiales bacterium]
AVLQCVARVRAIVFLLLAAGFAAGGAWAQSGYPSKPIKLIVGFPPGGGSDALARLIAAALTEKFGQQVVVDNKPGANTIVGTQYVQSQPADGYTLLFVSASFAINPSLYKLTYDIEKDFTPVAIVAIVPLLLITNNGVPAKTVRDLVAMAKAQPGKLTFASFGAGSAGHLAGEMLLSMTDTDMIHVPYTGSAPAITDVMGGRVTMMLPGIGSAINLAKDGKVKALGVSTAKRVSGAPDVPTMAESGVPGYDVATWESVQAPAGTPPEVVAKLNIAIREAVANNDLRQKMIGLGFEPDAMKSPAQSAQFVRSEKDKWGKLVRERNIKVE